jgi:predicted enzyme related to lactoylglutathione lyase
MHHSRLCAVLIDCRTSDLDGAARFWGEALGRSVDSNHPSSRGNYRMLETPPDEPIVEIQCVDHESRVHIDIETDDIAAEVARLTQLGAKVVDRLERWAVIERVAPPSPVFGAWQRGFRLSLRGRSTFPCRRKA